MFNCFDVTNDSPFVTAIGLPLAYLVGAYENIARAVAWPKTSERWEIVRRILLKAADDPLPPGDDDKNIEKDDWPSWGWPSPRLDAACGLPILAWRLGNVDEEVAAKLRRLTA